MLGGLHIVMAAWKALGKWLDSSGWTAALVQDDIATPGKADFFKGVACIQNKTCTPGHICSTVLQKAYSSYVEEHNDLADNFDEWRQLKEDENPQFKF